MAFLFAGKQNPKWCGLLLLRIVSSEDCAGACFPFWSRMFFAGFWIKNVERVLQSLSQRFDWGGHGVGSYDTESM
jgi:hypothetical protein